jgi:hypothetical protein
MIWLASYPRSGNTFFRVALYEVYGIASSEFIAANPQPDYLSYRVVKTHELPDRLVPADRDIPAIYLLRDGRDAVVSMARHRSDVTVPGSNYLLNLLSMICYHRNGVHYGGWSRHVRLWRKRAVLTLRFEELIAEPITCLERMRPWIDLPAPKVHKLPTFQQLREREVRFDDTPSVFSQSAEMQRRFFRRGQVGAWLDELPSSLLGLFYLFHGRTLRQLGYSTARRKASATPGKTWQAGPIRRAA